MEGASNPPRIAICQPSGQETQCALTEASRLLRMPRPFKPKGLTRARVHGPMDAVGAEDLGIAPAAWKAFAYYATFHLPAEPNRFYEFKPLQQLSCCASINRRNKHPMSEAAEFDLIVIGSGPAGEKTAVHSRAGGTAGYTASVENWNARPRRRTFSFANALSCRRRMTSPARTPERQSGPLLRPPRRSSTRITFVRAAAG